MSSDLAWFGTLPSHWQVRRASRTLNLVVGGTPPTGNNDYFDGDVPWLTIADMPNGQEVGGSKRFLSRTGVAVARIPWSYPGDLLYSFKLSIGKTAIVTAPIVTNEAIATIRASSDINMAFARWVLPLAFDAMASWNIYGAKLLNQQQLRAAQIPYPPLHEQQRIADYLDHETAEIDAFIADLKYAAELIRLRFNTHLTTIFAEVSDWVPIRRLAALSTGTTPATNSAQEVFHSTGVQWIRPGDIDEEELVVHGTRKLSHAGEAQVRVLHGPAVLMVGIGATVGRVGLVESDFSTNQQITAVLPRSVDAKYLYFALRSLSDFIRRTAHGNTLPIVNNAQLGSLRVPLVSPGEQQRIASELASEMRRTREAIEEIQQAIDLANERRAALIWAAVTGQIDVTQKRKPVAEVLENEVGLRV